MERRKTKSGHNEFTPDAAAETLLDVRQPGPLTLAMLDAISGGVEEEAPSEYSLPDAIDLSGVRLDNLAVEHLIGAGGMGEVWKAHDTELDIAVAVKVLPLEYAGDPQFVKRFLREARAVARLDHPNIVRVLQAGRRAWQSRFLRVMVMEYVEGDNAHQVLDSCGGRLEPAKAAEIALGVARALRYAHERGVVHRDIKPSNLLIPRHADGPIVKVLDFGLAVLQGQSQASSSLTREFAIIGTPQYMSPEQARGLSADSRSDVYSLGVTLFELLSGRLPYDAESVFSMIQAHIEQPLNFPAEPFDSLPQLRELIEGLCAKAPEDRLPLTQAIERLETFLGIPHSEPAATPAPGKARTNLTSSVSSFVGRGNELDELADRVKAGARLVTVLGTAGIGKTRFAREFGLSMAPEYQAGVWFCDLTEARTELGICHGVGQGMGIPLTQADPLAQIHAALRMRGRMLIILDNFEQVAEHAATTLGKWLQDTPEVQFIVTSREPLHLEGEQAFPLDTLAADDADAPAIRLFCDRAAEVRKDFKAEDITLDVIRRIVNELDGIPLAIELAAARVAAMPPKKILERLPQRFDLLTSRRRDAGTRQQTLKAAIDWSWNLLNPYEKLALAQCSVFRDGFFLEAAEEVLDLSSAGFQPAPAVGVSPTAPGSATVPVSPSAEGSGETPLKLIGQRPMPLIMDVIESLVEKSLLKAYQVPELPGEARYRMLESIRDYAERKMANPDALGARASRPHRQFHSKEAGTPTGPEAMRSLRLRHAKYYVSCAEGWDERIYGPEARAALDQIHVELENLFAIQDRLSDSHSRLAARAILSVEKTLHLRGPWHPRIHRMEQALRAIDAAIPDHTNRVERSPHTIALDSERELMRLRLLCAATTAHHDCGDRESMAKLAREGLAYSKALPETSEVSIWKARMLRIHGQVDFRLGQNNDALACYEEAEAIVRRIGAEVDLSNVLIGRANVLGTQGRFDSSQSAFMEAEAITRKLGSLPGTAIALSNRSNVHKSRGEFELAMACCVEAESIWRQLANRPMVAMVLSNRGNVHLGKGEFDAALAFYRDALEIERDIGRRIGIVTAVGNTGVAYSAMGRFAEALACYDEAEAAARELGHWKAVLDNVFNRACLYGRMGNYKEALVHLATASAISRELGSIEGLAHCLNNRGVIHHEMGQFEEAMMRLQEAEELCIAEGMNGMLATVVGNRGNVYLSQQRYEDALSCYLLAETMSVKAGSRGDAALNIGNRAGCLFAMKRREQALEVLQQAESVNRELHIHLVLSDNLSLKASILLEQSEVSRTARQKILAQALEVAEEARQLRDHSGAAESAPYFVILATLSKIHVSLHEEAGHPDEATRAVRQRQVTEAVISDVALALAHEAAKLAHKLGISHDHHELAIREAYGWVAGLLANVRSDAP
jgi:predicted ATPase